VPEDRHTPIVTFLVAYPCSSRNSAKIRRRLRQIGEAGPVRVGLGWSAMEGAAATKLLNYRSD
jgi:hypothetical protein